MNLNCVFCGGQSARERGLVLQGSFICPVCEQKICLTGPGQATYDDYIGGLKKIWRFSGLPPADMTDFSASLARR